MSVISQFMEAPKQSIRRLVQNLEVSVGLGIFYGKAPKLDIDILAFDANWPGVAIRRRSIVRYCTLIGGKLGYMEE